MSPARTFRITGLRAFRKLRPFLLVTIVGLIWLQILALTPNFLDNPPDNGLPPLVAPEELMSDASESTRAEGIPKGKIPEYTVDQFQYASVSDGIKQWLLTADRAFLFQKERVVHSRRVKALLYDAQGSTIVVTGAEAKYFMNQKDLEMYGEVKAVFPDGFEIQSDYMRYRPDHRRITVPDRYLVEGGVDEKDGQRLQFRSHGIDYPMNEGGRLTLLSAARITMLKPKRSGEPGMRDRTTIESDRCVLHRDKHVAHFTMGEARRLDERFVKIEQPGLFARSRKAQMNYGDFSQLVSYLVAEQDALIREIPIEDAEAKKADAEKPQLRYATAGRAEFDVHSDTITLREFPQVYQGPDTVTGDVIVVHRDTDVVEVDQSNAYSEGE